MQFTTPSSQPQNVHWLFRKMNFHHFAPWLSIPTPPPAACKTAPALNRHQNITKTAFSPSTRFNFNCTNTCIMQWNYVIVYPLLFTNFEITTSNYVAEAPIASIAFCVFVCGGWWRIRLLAYLSGSEVCQQAWPIRAIFICALSHLQRVLNTDTYVYIYRNPDRQRIF